MVEVVGITSGRIDVAFPRTTRPEVTARLHATVAAHIDNIAGRKDHVGYHRFGAIHGRLIDAAGKASRGVRIAAAGVKVGCADFAHLRGSQVIVAQ